MKTQHQVVLSTLVWIPCLLASACSSSSNTGPTSALLITLDTTRNDALLPSLTPHLEALSQDGVRFDRAYTTVPLTLPSHASMLSGLYPLRHGLRNNGAQRLSEDAETLAEIAQASGFQTAAFISSAVLDGAFGLNQGFSVYDSPRINVQQASTHYPERLGSEIVPRAIEWLKQRDPNRPYFLWVHIWDPHGPYEPPEEFRDVAPQHPYLGEIAAADKAVGTLLGYLKEQGLYEETTVMVVADHGEAFWEHGEFSHGSYCWDTTLHVPMILRHPADERRGQRIGEIASVTDVHPTLAAAMGLNAAADIDGHNLLAPLPPDRGAYFESYYGYLAYGWSPMAGWVDGAGKYIHSSKPIYLEAGSDEKEARPLEATDAKYERYRQAIGDLGKRSALRGAQAERGSDLSQEIGDLGYAEVESGSDLPHPLEPSEAPSPHEMVEEQKQTLEAQKQFNEGNYAECEKIHARILGRNPENMHSWGRMGICLIRQRRHLEAIPSLERVFASDRVTASVCVNLGICMRVAGRNGRAIQCFERALGIDGSHAQAVRHLVDLYGAEGQTEKAERMKVKFEGLTGQG